MFTVLFVAPLTITILQKDAPLVIQEFEDISDAEDVEDVQLEEAQEKLFCGADYTLNRHLEVALNLLCIDSDRSEFSSQKLGIETPPPRFA